MNDVFIRVTDMLPYWAKGQTLLDEDGNYNIYINEFLSDEAKLLTLRHELRHILRDDFYRDLCIMEIEG